MIKMEELKNLEIDELTEKVEKLKKELMQLRFQAKMGKLETATSIRSLRRDIARVMTAISGKKSAAQEKAEVKS